MREIAARVRLLCRSALALQSESSIVMLWMYRQMIHAFPVMEGYAKRLDASGLQMKTATRQYYKQGGHHG